MLKLLFQWLDQHSGSYWVLAWFATAGLALHVGLLLRSGVSASKQWKGCTLGDALVLWLFIIAWRWPFLLVAREFNPDESQLIAGAITLARHPVFWHSVDGTTSGPLNFYPLTVFAWLGLPLDYFTARLAGLFLSFGGLFMTYSGLAKKFGRSAAWLSILPAAGFFATVTNFDLIHYSSEQVSLFLTGLAIWLMMGEGDSGASRRQMACFVAGAAVWAKLQMAPVSMALFIWAFAEMMRQTAAEGKSRVWPALKLAAAFIAPTLLISLIVVATGQVYPAIHRYILQNLVYVGNARPFGEAMTEMIGLAKADGRFPWFLGTVSLVLLVAVIFLVVRRQTMRLLGVGALLVFAGVIAVVAPRREFLHYVLLLPLPLTFWLGVAIGNCWPRIVSSRGRWLTIGALSAIGLVLPVTRCFQPLPEIYGRFGYSWNHPRTTTAVFVHTLAGKTGTVAVWGWASDVYVETGLSQATRDAHSAWSIVENRQRDYYRSWYLDDLKRNNPSVFVDAVGPGAFCFEDRLTQAHEIFPELAQYIKERYTLVTDLVEARIYARNDLSGLNKMDVSRILELRSMGRLDNMRPGISPPTGTNSFQRKTIGSREVVMLLPPARMEWALNEDMRSVSVEFGFDPVAFEWGRSNGVEIIVELVDGNKARTLFRHLLDPAKEVADRLPRKITLPLGAFGAGAHLVVRSDPGLYGDTAWDWLYLVSLEFESK